MFLSNTCKNSNILNFYVFNDGNLEKKSVIYQIRNFKCRETKTNIVMGCFNQSNALKVPLRIQNILTIRHHHQHLVPIKEKFIIKA
jgi:hypothetical protein